MSLTPPVFSSVPAASLVILPSLSRADTNSQDFLNSRFRGCEIMVNQTAQASTLGFIRVRLQGRVPGTTQYYNVGTVNPATTVAWVRRLRVYPGATTALDSTGIGAGVQATVNEFLPGIWRITSTGVGVGAVTFSVTANLFS